MVTSSSNEISTDQLENRVEVRERYSPPHILQLASEPEFLAEIQTKVFRVFLLAIHSHLSALRSDLYFFILTQPLTVSVKEKGRKPNRKPYDLRNPSRNLKSENSHDYAQKPQKNFPFVDHRIFVLS
jgi:hypothetical protein